MEFHDKTNIDEEIHKKSVEYMKMVISTIGIYMKDLIKKHELTDNNALVEFSSQVIALLAASRYLALSVPAEFHTELMLRADHLINAIMQDFKLTQATLDNTAIDLTNTKNTAKA